MEDALTPILRAALARYNLPAPPLLRFPPPERDPLRLAPLQLGVDDTTEARELLAWWRSEARQLAAFDEDADLDTALPLGQCRGVLSWL